MSDPARVLTALGRLQGAAEGTSFEPLVKDLVNAMAADTTAADLRQEIEFLKAEARGDFAGDLAGNSVEQIWPYRGIDSP